MELGSGPPGVTGVDERAWTCWKRFITSSSLPSSRLICSYRSLVVLPAVARVLSRMSRCCASSVRVSSRIRTPLTERLVVLHRPTFVAVTLDRDLDVGMLAQRLGIVIECGARVVAQRVGIEIEEHRLEIGRAQAGGCRRRWSGSRGVG